MISLTQIWGLGTYITFFIMYTLLIAHPKATAVEKILFFIFFAVAILALTMIIWR